MPLIKSVDADFRVCQIDFETLIEIQREAERRGFATRWTSTDALRRQVREGPVLIQSLSREERRGTVRSYRCLLLFSNTGGDGGGISTIDLSPERLEGLERLDRDRDVRRALVQIFSLALGGISTVSKA